MSGGLRLRRSTAEDVGAIRALTAAAFAAATHSAPPVDGTGDPGEAALVVWLLDDPTAIPQLSLVAEQDGELVGHVIGSRGYVDEVPAVGVGPVSVHPDSQRRGVGSALMFAVLGAAQALDEPVVALLGDPAYYSRFGFGPASVVGIAAPDPQWGDFFQAVVLGTGPVPSGTFRYAEPFDRL
ncbi:MAG TPA: N-acetyltransferase [Nocardioides sp.]|nr:N-acetyltransferase [Nocardioides sp.]